MFYTTKYAIEAGIKPYLDRRDSPTTTEQNRLDWAIEIGEWMLLTPPEVARVVGLPLAVVEELDLPTPDQRRRRNIKMVEFLQELAREGVTQ